MWINCDGEVKIIGKWILEGIGIKGWIEKGFIKKNEMIIINVFGKS